jgi:hypothetical protein
MKVSIFSTIFATLLAASSAAPFDAPCQYQIDDLRLLEITATFHAGPVDFVRKIPADDKPHKIGKFIFFFFSLSLSFCFTTYQLKKIGNFNH